LRYFLVEVFDDYGSQSDFFVFAADEHAAIKALTDNGVKVKGFQIGGPFEVKEGDVLLRCSWNI